MVAVRDAHGWNEVDHEHGDTRIESSHFGISLFLPLRVL